MPDARWVGIRPARALGSIKITVTVLHLLSMMVHIEPTSILENISSISPNIFQVRSSFVAFMERFLVKKYHIHRFIRFRCTVKW